MDHSKVIGKVVGGQEEVLIKTTKSKGPYIDISHKSIVGSRRVAEFLSFAMQSCTEVKVEVYGFSCVGKEESVRSLQDLVLAAHRNHFPPNQPGTNPQ
jgi:hypothetical protein